MPPAELAQRQATGCIQRRIFDWRAVDLPPPHHVLFFSLMIKPIRKDPFLDFGYDPEVSCQTKQAGIIQEAYNYVPLDLEDPLGSVQGNIEYLASWMERFLKEYLSQGVAPHAFYPLGIIAGMCFTNPRGDSTVVVSGKPSKGFADKKPSKRWGECCIMIHGFTSEVVYDRHDPGSFIANHCRYFPRFFNADNPEHASLMEKRLELLIAQ